MEASKRRVGLRHPSDSPTRAVQATKTGWHCGIERMASIPLPNRYPQCVWVLFIAAALLWELT